MTAYVIFLRDRIKDPVELELYSAQARHARGDHVITPIVYYGTATALEGPQVDGVAVLAFETAAAARAWYDSDAYQAARAHRERGADCRVILVDGVA